MSPIVLWALIAGIAAGGAPTATTLAAGAGAALPSSYLCQPSFRRDWLERRPVEPYAPQPGDIFLATDQALWSQIGHWLAGGPGFHHSGICFARPDGTVALIEAGPFNSLVIEAMNPYKHMADHVAAGDRVWIRRRRVPLTPEQSARLTAFLTRQEGKPFALWRMLAQATPIKTRGPLRTWLVGRPNGPDRVSYFCSEMVVESCVAAGLMDAETARPSATLPRDLFFGRSWNPYLDSHLNLDDWYPPARWLPAPPSP